MSKKPNTLTRDYLKKFTSDKRTKTILKDFVDEVVLSDDGEVAYNFYELPEKKRVQLFFKSYVKSGKPSINDEKAIRQFFARWVKKEFPDVANAELRSIVDRYTTDYDLYKRSSRPSSGRLRRVMMVVLFLIVVIGLVAGGVILLGNSADELGESAPIGGGALLMALSTITYLWFLRQIGSFFRIIRVTVLLVIIVLLLILLINGGVIDLPF